MRPVSKGAAAAGPGQAAALGHEAAAATGVARMPIGWAGAAGHAHSHAQTARPRLGDDAPTDGNVPMPGAWQPLWIGAATQLAYAALHRSGSSDDATLGVVLAPPLFHELPRSRRLMTEVACGLAASGLPCLRFDYFGTGDSAGSGDQTDFTTMRADLDAAADVLRRLGGVGRIAVLTWRGGALPVSSWLEHGGDAERVVMWEPVLDGAAWMAELGRQDDGELRSTERYPLRRGVPVPADPGQLMGFDVSARLRDELAATHVVASGCLPPGRTWALLRPGQPPPSIPIGRVFDLPPGMPSLGEGVRLDSALFLSPRVQTVVDALGQALMEARAT